MFRIKTNLMNLKLVMKVSLFFISLFDSETGNQFAPKQFQTANSWLVTWSQKALVV